SQSTSVPSLPSSSYYTLLTHTPPGSCLFPYTTLFRSNYTELKPGDYVVHVNHGIGRFEGIKTLENNGTKRDYITITNQHGDQLLDRKSTRLNSSHVSISYAVFCLKKKAQERMGRPIK